MYSESPMARGLLSENSGRRLNGMIKKDLLRYFDAARGNRIMKAISVFRSPGAHAIAVFRFGSWLKRRNILIRIFLESLYFFMFYLIRMKWGIDLNRSADIGEGLYVGHFGGIELSGGIKIGKNVSISQKTTIGGRAGSGDNKGVPTIGDDVYIGPGAVIYGKITIGNNVKIGPNAIIYKDIPDNAVVVLDPGFKILSFKGNYPIAAE
jgi:serine O-acetyltransferase